MSDIPKFEVGQELFYVASGRRDDNHLVVITKMGRKWAEIEQVGRTTRVARFEFRSEYWNQVDGGDYSSPGTLYLSEQAYEDYKKTRKIAREVSEKLRWNCKYPLETMRKVAQLLGIEP